MSLVVAQVTEEGPRIVSDTRVAFPDDRRPSYRTGVLKTIVVSREWTVSFAGNVPVGLDAVRAFARHVNSPADVEDAIRDLAKATVESRGAVEFIVSSAANESKLIRIRSGGVERDLLVAWIGDFAAFERFQSERSRPQDPNLERIWASTPRSAQIMRSLGEAMSSVIADSSIESVNDFCVATASKDGAFNYFPSMFIHVGRALQIRDGDDLVSKMAQPVAEGGFAVSIVEPMHPGTPALGLNFPRARLGMLFLPLQFDEAQVVQDVSPNDFARVIRERFGVELCEPMLRSP